MVAVHFPPPREVELVTERVTAGVDSNSPFSVAAASIEFFEPQTPVWSAEDNGELSSQWDSICSPMQVSHPRVSASSVKQRAQFFEALIKSNTDTVIRCAYTEGGEQANSYRAPATSSTCGGSQSFSEVQLMLRVPNRHIENFGNSSIHPKYGSQDDMADLIERLQSQLEVKEREKQLTASALARKAQECDNLMRVVRELADSRAKVVSTKVSLQEKYAELQAEFHRMMRIADLSRTVSKENLAKTSRTQKALRETESELHSSRSQAAKLQSKSKKLKVENCQLKEKLSLLERLDPFEGVQESVCMREFTRYRVSETY